MNDMKENENIVYMWEDKGPSFTKMTKTHYLEAGNKELENDRFYLEVANDPSKEVKKSNDALAQYMMSKGEVCQNVAEFFENGDQKLPKF